MVNGVKNMNIQLGCMTFLIATIFTSQSFAQTQAQPKAPAPVASPAPAATAAAAPAAKSTAPAPAPAANAPVESYEKLLDDYYKRLFSREGTIEGIIKAYRRMSGKTDAKYNFIDSPEFLKEAEEAFKNNWKTVARKKLSHPELQYLMIYERSNLRKKVSDLDVETNRYEPVAEIFNPLVTKKLSSPAKR